MVFDGAEYRIAGLDSEVAPMCHDSSKLKRKKDKSIFCRLVPKGPPLGTKLESTVRRFVENQSIKIQFKSIFEFFD